ncbi:M14 family metallopeptidase [Alteribacillus sp. HJP-4]|uniref:M14 family metallopeptidase n=1 Tax=Alteribacillus sp. HJP-4 TaxID=2775394 RepID=UPI0035CD12DA
MIYHKAVKGDTPAKIAHQYHADLETFYRLNQCRPSDYIVPGENYIIARTKNASSEHINNCSFEYGWRELEKDSRTLSGQVNKFEIGRSACHLPIYGFSIGDGPRKLFISAVWHGNEWLNGWLLMKFLIALDIKSRRRESWLGYDVNSILKSNTIATVPLVNPDGAELVQEGVHEENPYYNSILEINGGMNLFHHWSANARGVDLNHQWPAGWKEESRTSPQRPFPRHYGGEAPLTEPEAKTVYTFSMEQEFDMVLALHSQGEEIYWGYNGFEPVESLRIAEKLAAASSYHLVKNAGSGAGYKDWFIKTFRRPGFTVETGIGQNPLPFSQSDRIWLFAVPLLLQFCSEPQ